MDIIGAVPENFSSHCRIAIPRRGIWFVLAWAAFAVLAYAGDLDTIGVTLLRQVDPTLKGNSVRVAHTEGVISTNQPPQFEVSPAAVGQPASLFTWISSNGTASTFPNTVGTESAHSDAVANNYYGATNGPAPQVSHVDNYEANYFVNNIIASPLQPSIPGRVVNQSFVFSAGDDAIVNPYYDSYAARYGTIFSSGVGNGGTVAAPGTCFNGLGVGIYQAGYPSAVGPAYDGRCKPDIVAPDDANLQFGSANSFTIPYVSGSAAVLVQAASRGDGGANTSAASDLRTIKALLLNGAIKPPDWTNSNTRPLDLRYGAGVLNLFNSWHQLRGGLHAYIESTTPVAGGSHPPGSSSSNEPVLAGWDYNTINTPSTIRQTVNHYYFQLTGTTAFTATLVWELHQNQTSINDLNLYLYNVDTGILVNSSASPIDNVEHLFITELPPGRYDLQVQKNPSVQISSSETYALVFEFFSTELTVARSGSDIVISWPIAPAGFRLLSTPTLTPPAWTQVAATPVVSNSTNVVTLSAQGSSQFFRLQRP